MSFLHIMDPNSSLRSSNDKGQNEHNSYSLIKPPTLRFTSLIHSPNMLRMFDPPISTIVGNVCNELQGEFARIDYLPGSSGYNVGLYICSPAGATAHPRVEQLLGHLVSGHTEKLDRNSVGARTRCRSSLRRCIASAVHHSYPLLIVEAINAALDKANIMTSGIPNTRDCEVMVLLMRYLGSHVSTWRFSLSMLICMIDTLASQESYPNSKSPRLSLAQLSTDHYNVNVTKALTILSQMLLANYDLLHCLHLQELNELRKEVASTKYPMLLKSFQDTIADVVRLKSGGKVFKIHEPLETILLELDRRTLLRMRRTSHSWHRTINETASLQ